MSVEGFGKTHVLVSSKVDCRTLTFGVEKQIAASWPMKLASRRSARACTDDHPSSCCVSS